MLSIESTLNEQGAVAELVEAGDFFWLRFILSSEFFSLALNTSS